MIAFITSPTEGTGFSSNITNGSNADTGWIVVRHVRDQPAPKPKPFEFITRNVLYMPRMLELQRAAARREAPAPRMPLFLRRPPPRAKARQSQGPSWRRRRRA